MKIPEEYTQLMPYLIVKGADDFRKFMTVVFDAKDQLIVPNEDGSLMHGELKIGNAVVMFAEAGGQFHVMNAGMFIYADDADATYKKHWQREPYPLTDRNLQIKIMVAPAV